MVEIHLPELKERIDDIPLLVNNFIADLRTEMGKNIKGITNQAMNALIRHTWKGQVRELQNVVERAMIFCDAEYLDVTHLPEDIQRLVDSTSPSMPADTLSLKDAVRNFERQFIESKLKDTNSDKEKVAAELGLSLSTLYRKMEELHIPLKNK